MDRRDFLKTVALAGAGMLLPAGLSETLAAFGQEAGPPSPPGGPATVYMTNDISPKGLMVAYKALNREMAGRVAVKLSTGEAGGHHYLSPDLIKDLIHAIGGTIVEGNTAYKGKRATLADHMKVAEDHGFAAIARVDILDAEGEIRLPVAGGTHLAEVRVGSHFADYDSCLVLTHFKGHLMAGFGGALKNIAIGIASPAGKCLVHTAGHSETDPFDGPEKREDFLESMAEAAQGMIAAVGSGNMLYINVLNNLSVDCDCASNPAAPELPDIGILASLDPVAIDRASVDLVYAADPGQSAPLRERMESRKGTHILAHAERLGVGGQGYKLVNIG